MYLPMYGSLIAFQDYSPSTGMLGSKWVGFKHFVTFFQGNYFWRVLKNTLLISLYDLVFNFPAPIVLALLINEMKGKWYKSTVQTISYFPHFISLIVVCGLIKQFTLSDGIINNLLVFFGAERSSLLQRPELFRMIYIGSDIWQNIGWSSIIYFAALSAIDTQLYDACEIDGGGRFRKIWHITIPGIMPTIVVLLILKLGSILNVGFEKVILLYNPMTYETADIISSYVYRKGLQEFSYSFASAVGLFNSVINFVILIGANSFSRKLNSTSLW
jgi:putative aldouronate transport system permease protein